MALTESQSFLVTMEFIFSGVGLWSNKSFTKLEKKIMISKTITATKNNVVDNKDLPGFHYVSV